MAKGVERAGDWDTVYMLGMRGSGHADVRGAGGGHRAPAGDAGERPRGGAGLHSAGVDDVQGGSGVLAEGYGRG